MEGKWSHVPVFWKYLVPKNNKWLRRICILFVFILLDYFATLAFCTTPEEEANPYARIFLENYGIGVGLTMFVFLINFQFT